MTGQIEDNTEDKNEDTSEGHDETEAEVSEAVADGDIVVDFDETVGDLAAVLDVEKMEAKVESTSPDEVAEKAAVRKRLEEIREQQESALDSTYNIKLDDDFSS